MRVDQSERLKSPPVALCNYGGSTVIDLDMRMWEQDWKRWIHDMEFKYKYLVEIILKQRATIKELEEKLARIEEI